MGVGFMASCKRWATFPIQPSHPRQLQRPPSASPLRSRETLFESGRSTHHAILEGGEVPFRESFKANAISYSVEQTIGSISLYDDNLKINNGPEIYNSTNYPSPPISMRTNTSSYVSSLKSSSHLQFGLLMENVDQIEDIFAGEELVRLKRDIIVHIGKLGALDLFHACLSRTLMTPSDVNTNLLRTEQFRDCPTKLSEEKTNTIIRTGKCEERKLRRMSASSKRLKSIEDSKVSSLNGLGRPKGSSTSRRRRSLIARNESQMSKGVKEVADLERTRLKVEGEIGHSASYARWAEAAGIGEKILQQRLQYGWYCRDKLIKSTHSLVVYLARNYRGMGIAFDDLLQAGNMGVLKGAERFDNTRGYRFSTYVQYWIKKSILALLARHSKGIHIPVTMERYIKRIQKARRSFYGAEGRYPEDDEMAKLTGLSLANVRLARKCSRVGDSLDKEIVDGWHTKFIEVTSDTSIKAPDEIIARQHMRRDVVQVLEGLHPRERQVLVLRYGLEDGRCKSLGEIAKCYSVTKEWIRKIERMALAKIRRDDIKTDLKCYLNL